VPPPASMGWRGDQLRVVPTNRQAPRCRGRRPRTAVDAASHAWAPRRRRQGRAQGRDARHLLLGCFVSSPRSPTDRAFGRHVRGLRKARGLTQDVLAEQGGLSPDTIRRLEHGAFSPSLDTLRKLCVGLDLRLSTLFESYELGECNEMRELIDLIATRSRKDIGPVLRVMRAFFDEIDELRESQ